MKRVFCAHHPVSRKRQCRSVTIATDAWNLVTGDRRPVFPNQGTDVLLAVAH